MKYIFVGKRNVRNKLENETACCAQIAQSVEQETENLRVRGSIPRLGTKKDLYNCIGLIFMSF